MDYWKKISLASDEAGCSVESDNNDLASFLHTSSSKLLGLACCSLGEGEGRPIWRSEPLNCIIPHLQQRGWRRHIIDLQYECIPHTSRPKVLAYLVYNFVQNQTFSIAFYIKTCFYQQYRLEQSLMFVLKRRGWQVWGEDWEEEEEEKWLKLSEAFNCSSQGLLLLLSSLLLSRDSKTSHQSVSP